MRTRTPVLSIAARAVWVDSPPNVEVATNRPRSAVVDMDMVVAQHLSRLDNGHLPW
jgi:hypothetical protein